MANAFKTSVWPMLLILAEAKACSTSGAHKGGGPPPPLPKWGQRLRPPAPFGEGRPAAALIICAVIIKSFGLR